MSSASVRTPTEGAQGEDMTGYDATFDPEPEPKYVCPVCLAVLRDPVQTKCGHRFCRTCLRRSCGNNARFAKCPVDNTLLDIIRGTFEDNATKREVLSLTVRCRYLVQEDCDWLGELRNLEPHEESCPRSRMDCVNECGERMRRCDQTRHLAACSRRLERCPHCRENTIVADMARHSLLVCPRFPVTCVICHTPGLLREDIPRHLDPESGDCPLSVVTCAFSRLGCHFQAARRDMDAHDMSATNHHMLLLVARQGRQQEQLNTNTEQLARLFAVCTEFSRLSASQQRLMTANQVALQSQASHLEDLQISGCSGRLLWKINLPEDNTCQLRSPHFYTGRPGYRLSLTLELAGFRDYNEIYSSLFVNIEKGHYDDQLKFPFEGVCHVTIHDHSEDPDVRSTFTTSIVCRRVPRCNEDTSTSGCHQRGRLKLMRTTELLGGAFVDQGALLLQVDAFHFHTGGTI